MGVDDEGIVNDVEDAWSLAGRETLRSMRDRIFLCVVVVVVVVVALMVAVGVVVLMVAVVVLLVIVVRVLRELCIGVVEVMEILCIEVVEVDCTGMLDIMVLGRVFVVEMVEGVELVVKYVTRLVLWCANGKGYFLCCFRLMSAEVNELSVNGCLFGIVILAHCFLLLKRDFLVEDGRYGHGDGGGG